jgi:hypothetical protein
MANFRQLSDPQVARLTKLYGLAEKDILNEVSKALLKNPDRKLTALKGMLQNVQQTRAELLAGSKQWVEEIVPQFYEAGVEGVDAALGMLEYGAVHQEAMQVLADQTFSAFQEIDHVIGRRTDDLYRSLALENSRANVAGYAGWRQVADSYQKDLAERGVTGFVDKSGREWNMETYSEMVARTSTRQIMNEGTKNRLQEHGHDLAKISSNESEKTCDVCEEWAGEVVSLSGDTDGYPTLDEAEEAGVFHPNCTHTLGPAIEEELANKAEQATDEETQTDEES